MSAPVVELIDARKTIGQVEAVRGVSLQVGLGEVVAILGPNGAGKTTCINLMLGLRRPTSGQARLFGLPPESRGARSRCGVMLQESGVLGQLEVRELVDLFCSYYPHPMPVNRAIGLAGLAGKAQVQAGKLSGGQRQRLYFALAVCGDPDLLFLDEPTVGMDVEARRGFLDTIREFSADGKAIVMTTHYIEEADALADRVILIDRGLVIADASPTDIKSRVATKRVTFSSSGQVTQARLSGLHVASVQNDEGRVSILSNQPEELLWQLHERGVEIRELEVTGVDLEQAIVSLMDRPHTAIA